MDRSRVTRRLRLALGVPLLIALGAYGCSSDEPQDPTQDIFGQQSTGSGNGQPGGTPITDPNNPPDNPGLGAQNTNTVLDEREYSYTEALHLASMKLLDTPPTLSQVKRVQNSDDPKADYETLVDEMFEDPRFNRRMIRWWRDTFRQGGGDLDTAPVFAARIVAEELPFSDMFTATSNNCPTYDNATETFVDGDCANNAPVQAGVLTNPGVMQQFYGNMAFRRVRWVQEMFACTKFPAEYAEEPSEVGDGAYFTSPWEFESVANAPIDFQDTSAVICANCHTTMNHLAPLFGNFDENGMWQNEISVMTPVAPDPVPTELSHWLRDGETTHWRLGQPVNDLAELGQAMVDDPVVWQCMAARMWNFTMSKEDIVSDLSTVPLSVIQHHTNAFAQSGNVKAMLRFMMKSEDFTKF